MTNLTECEKHEMIGCQVCSPPPAPERESDSGSFLARYDDQCPDCDLPIMAGKHRIYLRRFDWGNEAIHETCAR